MSDLNKILTQMDEIVALPQSDNTTHQIIEDRVVYAVKGTSEHTKKWARSIVDESLHLKECDRCDQVHFMGDTVYTKVFAKPSVGHAGLKEVCCSKCAERHNLKR